MCELAFQLPTEHFAIPEDSYLDQQHTHEYPLSTYFTISTLHWKTKCRFPGTILFDWIFHTFIKEFYTFLDSESEAQVCHCLSDNSVLRSRNNPA